MKTLLSVATIGLVLAAPTSAALRGDAAMPRLYRNCTALNAKYPHGLGRANAVDKTSGERVTNFRRSTRLFLVAMSYNRGLDRDKDRVACEKL